MRIGIISFTKAGKYMADRVGEVLSEGGHACSADGWHKGMSLSEWTKKCWVEKEAIIFIGAAGIAVRAIAPCLKDKFTDPAVLAMDEKGQFAIPLVSGHVGGANELALFLEKTTGAAAVITTATDVNQMFAVDVFARKQNLHLSDRNLAKQVSAALLAGEKPGWKADWGSFPVPKGFFEIPKKFDREESLGVWITLSSEEKSNWLKLIPKAVILGIGCRRGTASRDLSQAADEMLADCCISPYAVLGVATINIKEKEPAILELVHTRGWQLFSYTAEQLQSARGEFSESEFVQKTVGVGNVCERAVVCSEARLTVGKTRFPGITMALGIRENQ